MRAYFYAHVRVRSYRDRQSSADLLCCACACLSLLHCRQFRNSYHLLRHPRIRDVCRIVFRNAGFCRRHHSAVSYDSLTWAKRHQSGFSPSTTCSRPLEGINYKGEFVDFDDLLPEMLGPADREVFQLSVRDSQGPLMPPRQAGSSVRRRVYDLSTWMEAWTSFMRVVIKPAD